MQCEIVKVHHTGITVRDLEESVRFYEQYFGFRTIGGCDTAVEQDGRMKGSSIRIAFLRAGDEELELLQYTHPRGKKKSDFNPWDAGVQHVSFKTTGIRDFYEQNRDSLEFLTPPVDYTSEEIDTTWTYLKDPNGTLLELSEDRKPRDYWKK